MDLYCLLLQGSGSIRKISSIDYYRSSKTSISSRYLIFSASILEDFWYTPSGSLELSTYPALGVLLTTCISCTSSSIKYTLVDTTATQNIIVYARDPSNHLTTTCSTSETRFYTQFYTGSIRYTEHPLSPSQSKFTNYPGVPTIDRVMLSKNTKLGKSPSLVLVLLHAPPTLNLGVFQCRTLRPLAQFFTTRLGFGANRFRSSWSGPLRRLHKPRAINIQQVTSEWSVVLSPMDFKVVYMLALPLAAGVKSVSTP